MDQTFFDRPRGNLRARTKTQLAQDICDMGRHGALTDDQSLRNLAIGFSLRDERRNLSLARGEPSVPRAGGY